MVTRWQQAAPDGIQRYLTRRKSQDSGLRNHEWSPSEPEQWWKIGRSHTIVRKTVRDGRGREVIREIPS